MSGDMPLMSSSLTRSLAAVLNLLIPCPPGPRPRLKEKRRWAVETQIPGPRGSFPSNGDFVFDIGEPAVHVSR